MGRAMPSPGGAPAVPDLPPLSGGGGAKVAQSIGNLNVYAAPGQSVNEVADAVVRKLDDRARMTERRALHDW
jgi:hypothetical protein